MPVDFCSNIRVTLDFQLRALTLSFLIVQLKSGYQWFQFSRCQSTEKPRRNVLFSTDYLFPGNYSSRRSIHRVLYCFLSVVVLIS